MRVFSENTHINGAISQTGKVNEKTSTMYKHRKQQQKTRRTPKCTTTHTLQTYLVDIDVSRRGLQCAENASDAMVSSI